MKEFMPGFSDSLRRVVSSVAVLLETVYGNQVPPSLQVGNYSGPMTDWGIQGEVKTSQAWIDSGDSTVLVISEIQKGQPNDKAFRSEVFGYRYTKRNEKWTKDFSIKEANQSPNEIVHYQSGSTFVKDVDGIGGAETGFFYSVAMDGGTESLVLKMIFHWNGKKAPIRGKIPRELDADGIYQMTLDPQLKTAPQEIRDFAVGHWKAYVKAKYGELVPNP